ncbi:translocase [Gammaproteobacteria bacterium]|nr:translocase [Gammaproteobacteria bacterium]
MKNLNNKKFSRFDILRRILCRYVRFNGIFFHLFYKYASIGVLNTLIHAIFFFIFIYLSSTQALANFLAFCISVTFSFFMNARFTFKKTASLKRYIFYAAAMGIISYLFGKLADYLDFFPIFTLIGFSMLSLILGFLYSKLFVFNKLS